MPSNTHSRSARGFIVTSIAVASGTFLIVIASLFTLQAAQSLSIQRQYAQLQARALAEGGLDHALEQLRADPSYTGETLTLGSGSVVLNITPDDLDRQIQATGQSAGTTVTLGVTAVGDVSTPGSTFQFAIQSDTGGTATGQNRNPTIDGNLFSNGDVSILGAGAHVTGDVSAGGAITNRGTIDGVITEGAEAQPLPSIDVEAWRAAASEGQTHAGDYAISTNGTYVLGAPDNVGVITGRLLVPTNATIRITGPLWIKGAGGSALEMSGNARFELDPALSDTEMVIVADGRLTFSGNGLFTTGEGSPTRSMLLMSTYPATPSPSTTAIAINANTRFVNTALFAPNGQIAIGQSASGLSVTSLTAQRLFIDSNAKITYATGLVTANFSVGSGPSSGSYAPLNGSYTELPQ